MTASSPLWFTASWDDGHPLDSRIAELFDKHGFDATFYVPNRNREGYPVLSPETLRSLDGRFEIASHTHDHTPLRHLQDLQARQQIEQGKSELEQILGHAVRGFCYPRGQFRPIHTEMVRNAGFAYARTSVNFATDLAADCFLMPITMQFYPHTRGVLLRNYLWHGDWRRRYKAFQRIVSDDDLETSLAHMFADLSLRGGVMHIWGHSWELDTFGGWPLLDRFLSMAAQDIPRERRITNARLAAISGESRLTEASDNLSLHKRP
jgi:peptidoglycan/xylan/chitin deacetylase (PgdA/CDA1 family)